VLWQNVAVLIQGNRGKSSGGKVNSTENSEEPNSRLQTPEKPKHQTKKVPMCNAGALEPGYWNFSGCWSLEFGAFFRCP
jgi:hypothetical protein